jgi:hypothetical protein
VSDTPKTDELAKREFITDGVWIRHARKLERENAALRADKERLDWLSQTKCAYYYEGQCCWRINEDKNTDGDTLRDAIDAARKEAQP